MKNKTLFKKIFSLSNGCTLISLVIGFGTLGSLASSKNCLEKEEYYHSEKISNIGLCKLWEPKLKEGYIYYPKFSLPYRNVQYWEGGYYRKIIINQLFLVKTIDYCSKPPGTVVDYKWINKPYIQFKYFGLSNPNLDPKLEYSYLLSPMTEEQVQDELPSIKQQCEAYAHKNILEF